MNLNDRLNEVRQEYLARMTRHSTAGLLQQVEQYITARDGKMLRPRMTLLAAVTLGDEAFLSRRTLLLATAVEMLHNVSLLHDDVVDHADQRRGRPSVNASWGNSVAVLAGDYLLAQIMQLMSDLDDADASRMINRTVMAMSEAELIAQEVERGLRPMTEQTYLDIVDGKTARLFAAAAAMGNPAYEDFGLHYGRLFQLLDDQADGDDQPYTAALIVAERAALSSLHSLPMQ